MAGEISARWTTRKNTRAVATIHFADKPWVFDFQNYRAKNKGNLAVGFSPRLARSPGEAFTSALRSKQAGHNQVVDRFVQKLTLPYGELWQESVLLNKDIPATAMAGDYKNLVPLVRNEESNPPAAIASNAGQPFEAMSSGEALAYHDQHSQHGFEMTPAKGLFLTLIGLGLIGWISNVLTQGYYRQNIKHLLITGVAVLFGLLLLRY